MKIEINHINFSHMSEERIYNRKNILGDKLLHTLNNYIIIGENIFTVDLDIQHIK